MLDYVKYSPSPYAHYEEIELKGGLGGVSSGIVQLGDLLTNCDWDITRLWTPSVDCGYIDAPFIGGSFYRPYTMYHSNVAIGYYDPATGPPSTPPGPVSVAWFEAKHSAAETLQHTAFTISSVYAGWVGETIGSYLGYPYGIRVSHPGGGPFFNNQLFAPDPSMGIGGYTQGGGYTVRCKDYRSGYVELDLYTVSSFGSHNLYITVKFGGGSDEYSYRLGRYNWKCLANPHQLVMFAEDGTGEVGDVAQAAKGFLVTLPKIQSTLPTPPDYVGVACGGFWNGSSYYNGGDITFHENRATSRIRIDDLYSPGVLPYQDFDTGLQFIVMYHDQDYHLSIGNDVTFFPMNNPAYLAVSKDPSNVVSLAKIVGYLWDAFVTTQYIPRGSEITLDNHVYVCVFSQQSSTLKDTATSMCVLKYGNGL